MSDVAEFYDQFAERQEKSGINRRHLSIDNWLTQFGLHENHSLLEVGCGIGTQTELICERLNDGKVVACDISEKSIERAQQRLKRFKNLNLFSADIIEYPISGSFDFILLPDVLEHIPEEQHAKLFEKLSSVLKEEGKIVIHIPDPYYLAWRKTQDSETDMLQIIDQSIYTNELVNAVYSAGLYIEHLQSYSLHVENNDYQIILLRKKRSKEYPPVQRGQSIASRIKGKLGI